MTPLRTVLIRTRSDSRVLTWKGVRRTPHYRRLTRDGGA